MLEIVKSFLSGAEPSQSGSVQGQYYERTGGCNQCGKCCSHIYLVYGQQTINSVAMFEDIKAKNPEYQYFKPLLADSDEEGLLFQCVHLQADKSCGIYNDRPNFCRQYPSEHAMLMGGKLAEGCGYQFRLLKTFQDVLRQMAPPGTERLKKPDSASEEEFGQPTDLLKS
ncbi:YkgJ family cysteine cluster protein [Vampirovibrio chlorellavorus]|uniref:YkgJ family cysteine cluster protein n=1 Tax=Vampirovibrio chlorellavorus TaxID=758823 RepID=UPI0026F05A3C|nr:YkgJ family cysteine cluster protein [Vampirovibrio chlorellavorus]